MSSIPTTNHTTDTVRDAWAADLGAGHARTDREMGRTQPSSDEHILATLDTEAGDAEVTGWAQDACLRGYRRVWDAYRAPTGCDLPLDDDDA